MHPVLWIQFPSDPSSFVAETETWRWICPVSAPRQKLGDGSVQFRSRDRNLKMDPSSFGTKTETWRRIHPVPEPRQKLAWRQISPVPESRQKLGDRSNVVPEALFSNIFKVL